MLRQISKYGLALILSLSFGIAHADNTLFSTDLFTKFQAKACTNCHDFFEKEKNGRYYKSHAKRRDVNRCSNCHSHGVTGFEHVSEWFALPGLYLSGMDAKTTCETVKKVLHSEFKSDTLLANQLKKHLFEDPRVLWAIEGATEQSGNLPFSKKEPNLVKGGLEEWQTQVVAWINDGMKCQ